MKRLHPLAVLTALVSKKSFVKLSALIALVIVMLPKAAQAQNVLQNTFTIKVELLPLKEIIAEVQKQTSVNFAFSSNAIKADRTASYTASQKTIADFLAFLQSSFAIEYKLVNDRVVLYTTATATTTSPTNKAEAASKTTTVDDKSFKATVYNEKNEPIPGVTVIERGKANGAATNDKGQVALKLINAKANLVFSSEGYETTDLPVSRISDGKVVLKTAVKGLDDVVVVGYGTIRKSDLTGSVSKVKLENASQQTSSSFEQLLQGKTSGVNITQTSGDPGSGIVFNIRGGNSLDGNQPLIVIDGYPVESNNSSVSSKTGSDYWTGEQQAGNALANLNPNDIESIEILKDASSTAIFGSRGANGVVMITTKRGKDAKDKFSYNFRQDQSELPKQIKMLNTPDFIRYANEASVNSGVDSAYRYTSIATAKDNNWQDLVFKKSFSKDHQVSFTGGDFKTKYAIIGSYTSIDGVVKYTNYTKEGISLNLDRTFSSRFKMGISSKMNFSTNSAGYQSTNHDFKGGSVVTGALRWSPTSTLLDDDGEIIVSTSNQSNPLITLERSKNLTTNVLILANLFAEYNITKDLRFKVSGGFNQNTNEYKSYWSRGTLTGDNAGGQAYRGNNNNLNYLTEFTLNYSGKVTNKSRLTAVAGYTAQNWQSGSTGIIVKGFPNDNLLYYALAYGANLSYPVSSYKEWALSSFLGRVNYTINDKYILTLTGRADGSSRLAAGHEWDFFPSAALGWNLQNEKFIKQFKFINKAKLRASYGLSGNQNISVGATQALFGVSRAAINYGSIVTGLTQTSFANPNLRWEKTDQYNFGLDLTLFRSKLSMSVDLYKKVTRDLLINLAMPADNGFLAYSTNLGQVQNYGLEIEADVKMVDTKKFKWLVSGNITFSGNKVDHLGQNQQIMGMNLLPTALDQSGTIALPGYAIGSFYGYKIDGIYQNQGEIAKGPIDPVNPTPGDFRYVDLNKNGRIDAGDRTILGNPNPNYSLGLTNNFTFRNFEASIMFMAKVGQSVLNLNRFYSDGLVYSASGNLRQEAYDNRWMGEGTSNYYPRAKRTGSLMNKRVSDFLVEDASFLRLKTVNMSYRFPPKTIKFITDFKVFISATNLWILTDYKGYDPEVSGFGLNGLNQNIDFGTIPQYRTFSLGVNVGF